MDCGVDLEPRNSAVLDHLDYVRGLSSKHRIVATNNTVAAESVLGAFDGQVCSPEVLCGPMSHWTQQEMNSTCIRHRTGVTAPMSASVFVYMSQNFLCTDFCSN